MITLELLRKTCPTTKPATLQVYLQALIEITDYYDISKTPERLAGFLSQIAHESGGFTAVTENLNYSATGLRKIFPKYFPTDELAKQYERKPQMIANRVYANRMSNGPETSGDGWKFRGRGLIQLTGKANYTKIAEDMNLDIDSAIEYLESPEGAVTSAGWFWDNNDLNGYCDRNDFIGLTKRINGGTHGLEDRQNRYRAALAHLKS